MQLIERSCVLGFPNGSTLLPSLSFSDRRQDGDETDQGREEKPVRPEALPSVGRVLAGVGGGSRQCWVNSAPEHQEGFEGGLGDSYGEEHYDEEVHQDSC